MAYSLQRERITQYMQDTYGTKAEYLWADSPDSAVFRHPSSRKWYAIIMSVLPALSWSLFLKQDGKRRY